MNCSIIFEAARVHEYKNDHMTTNSPKSKVYICCRFIVEVMPLVDNEDSLPSSIVLKMELYAVWPRNSRP